MAKQPQRQIVHTADGSASLFLPELNAQYHSIHGAVQESMHVFIREGFQKIAPGRKKLSVLEVGFGTGLNCLLTCLDAENTGIAVHYTAIEPYPLVKEEYEALNYHDIIASGRHHEAGNAGEAVQEHPSVTAEHVREDFLRMHTLENGREGAVNERFILHKIAESIQDVSIEGAEFDLVYYDAFGPQATPEMWEEAIFRKLFTAMRPGGMLITYCARGSVKRALRACGFALEHPKGPPGKREITRAGRG